MSNIGNTTDKDPKDEIVPTEIKAAQKVVPLTDKDVDMKTLNELRGIAGKMEKGYQTLHQAKLSLNEKATVQGVMAEQDVMRQRFDKQQEQLRRLVGMYQTLQAKFDQFETQRIIELQGMVGGGSTTPGDYNDDSDRPGDVSN